jgi:hypothetical protein
MADEQLSYIRERFPTTTALTLARELGVSECTVYKYTRLMGLTKDHKARQRMLSKYGKMGGLASAKLKKKAIRKREKTETCHDLLLEHADSLDTLASMLCGFGRYDYFPDKKGTAIPIEAVRQLLRIGAVFKPIPIEAVGEYLRMGHEFKKQKRKK